MDRARHELLARAGLARDQNGAACRGDLPDQVEDLPHRGGVADDVLEARSAVDLLAEVAVLRAVPRRLERALDQQLEGIDVEGLCHEVEGAELHRLDGGLDCSVGGQHDDGHPLVEPAQTAHERDAIRAGHLDVREDQRRGFLLESGERLLCALEGVRLEAQPFHHDLEDAPRATVVVDDEHLLHRSGSAAGSFTCTRVPSPGRLSNSTVPR
jgi:hypothetical protein